VGTAVRYFIPLALSSFGSPIITKTNHVVIMNKRKKWRSKQQTTKVTLYFLTNGLRRGSKNWLSFEEGVLTAAFLVLLLLQPMFLT
jgi:hypothetical protein